MLSTTFEPGATLSTARIVNGCFVLAVGNEVLLQPTEAPSDCKLPAIRNPFITASDLKLSGNMPVFRVTRFARSDVLRISPFLENCGTTDGISSCDAKTSITPVANGTR